MTTVNIPRYKLLRVKFLLSNGIDQEEHFFKIEPYQPDFYHVKAGQFVLLSSNLKNNFATFGRIVGVICNIKQIKSITSQKKKIPQAMKIFQLTEEEILDLLEGMEIS
ncbi:MULTISPECIES: hypothetical protein [Lactococcus]|uniref:hypothetical protein n=1 Tax=Lactococcus TaxID=1357 RepID=UPI001F598A1F|nr:MULTISPECIES: hypothetical protein [Lactococcus]